MTVDIGFNPAFSARVNGIISIASAKDLKQYCSIPAKESEYSIILSESSISGAPPPAIKALEYKK